MKKGPGHTALFDGGLVPHIQPNGEIIPGLRLVPFSEIARKQRYYDRLIKLGWRYHSATAEWFDFSGPTLRCGRFSYKPDLSEAWIIPPARPGDSTVALIRLTEDFA